MDNNNADNIIILLTSIKYKCYGVLVPCFAEYVISSMKLTNLSMFLLAIREDRTRGGRSTYQCSYTLPNTIPQSGPLPGGVINPSTPNTSSSSSCPPSTAFVSATVSNLNHCNGINGNGPSSLPLGLTSGNEKSEDNMDLSTNVQSLARSSWSTNTTPTPPRVELPSSTNLPPNITEGPPPLEQTVPVPLTTKSNVPALLKVCNKIYWKISAHNYFHFFS